MIRTGRLDQRIVVQEKSVTRDAYGGEVVTWVPIATVWAEAEPWRLRERLAARKQMGEAAVSFRVRAPLAIALDHRVSAAGKSYEVVEIDVARVRQGEIAFIARGEQLG